MNMTLLMTVKFVRRERLESLRKQRENPKEGRGREAGETFIAVRVRKEGALSGGSGLRVGEAGRVAVKGEST